GYTQERAKCDYCSFECASTVVRCEEHFKVCSSVNISVLQEYFGQDFERPRINCPNPRYTKTRSISQPSKLSNKRNSDIAQFFDQLSTSEQKELEFSFAEAIFQCGLPLSFSELEPIIKLFKKARPSFQLPKRKKTFNNITQS
ncbi:1529_t:CDS:1, partial [Gigaspora rosea]